MPNQALLAQLEKLSAVEKLEVIQFLADSLQVHMRDASPGRPNVPQQGRAQPPPPPPSSSSSSSLPSVAPSVPPPPPPPPSAPSGRLELAAAPGQPALGRMSAESTMQLSVSDLIETEEDAEFVAALTSSSMDDVAADQVPPDQPPDGAEHSHEASQTTAASAASDAPREAEASAGALAGADASQEPPSRREAASPSGQQGAADDAAGDAVAAEQSVGEGAGSGGSLDGVGLTADALARQVDDAMASALDGPLVPKVAASASEPVPVEGQAQSAAAEAAGDAPEASAAEASQVSIATQASSTASEHELPVLDDVPEAAAPAAASSEAASSSEAAQAEPPAQEEPEEAFVNEDSVFESLILELADDELRLMETLSAVRRHFWSPLQAGFKALDTEDLKTTIQTMEFAPLRIAIGELVNSSIIALVQKYHDFLSQHLEAQGIQPAAHRDLFVTKKNQAQLVLALRTPFRDYIARLEQLDQARDALLDALQEVDADAIAATSPVLSSSRKQILEQYEEARGIEGAWRTLLDVIRFAELPPEAEGALEAFSSGLDAFLEQLSTIYRDVLERVLELWGAHLMAPAKSVLPGL